MRAARFAILDRGDADGPMQIARLQGSQDPRGKG